MLNRRTLLLIAALLGEEVLIDLICEVVADSQLGIKLPDSLIKFDFDPEIKFELKSFIKSILPTKLELKSYIKTHYPDFLESHRALHFNINNEDLLIKANIYFEIITKRIALLISNDKILSTGDFLANMRTPKYVAQPKKLLAVIDDLYKACRGKRLIGNIRHLLYHVEDLHVGKARDVASPKEISGRIISTSRVGKARRIVKPLDILKVIISTIRVGKAKRILPVTLTFQDILFLLRSGKGVELITKFPNEILGLSRGSLHSVAAIYLQESISSNFNGNIYSKTVLPVHLSESTNIDFSSSVTEKTVLPLKIALDGYSATSSIFNPDCVLPIHFNLENTTKLFDSDLSFSIKHPIKLSLVNQELAIYDSSIKSYPATNLSLGIRSNFNSTLNMSLAGSDWEYPTWLTSNNLKITQANTIIVNDSSLTIE